MPSHYVSHIPPSPQYNRGPKIPFRLGRTDADSGETSPKTCGLPDADKGSRANTTQHVRDVFYRKFVYFGSTIMRCYRDLHHSHNMQYPPKAWDLTIVKS